MASLRHFSGGGAVHAASVTVQPSNPSNNEVEADDESYTVNGTTTEINYSDIYYDIYGGYSTTEDSNNNKVTFGGGTIYGSFYGGYSNFGKATNNILNIIDGTLQRTIYGGYSVSDATGNIINFGGTRPSFPYAYSAIYGGYSTSGIAKDNEVNITSGIVGTQAMSAVVYGGYSYSSNATNNTVTIDGGAIGGVIYGGSSPYGNATGNIVNINGGTLSTSYIFGGSAISGNANGNTINITGGDTSKTTLYKIIINGGNSVSIANDNIINISGNPNLMKAVIYGGSIINPSWNTSGNTLNIYTKNLTAQNIGRFNNINFYLGSNISNGDTLLTLTSTDGTDVTATDIQAVMQSGSPLTNGDTVTLLTNASGVTAAKSYTGTAAEGVSLTYPLTVYRNDEGTAILARLGSTSTDTSGTDTSGTDSSGTDSSGTDSSGSDTSGTDSSGTDSSGTDSSGTDSSGTDSSGTDSSGSDTSGTDSSGTDTSGTDSSGTDSSGTDSSGTDTSGTDSSGTDSSGNDSSGNDSSGTDSSGTDSSGSDTSAVDDSSNTVNLYSTNSGTIYGGYTDSGNASNNTVNLYSGTFENIYGGYAPNGETSNNTLNVYNKNISAQNLSNFSAMNFYIPNDASSGDTMLNLTDSAATDLSGVAIRAGVVAGNENLAVGDTINLLTNPNGFKTDSATSYGRLTEGVSLDYGLTVSNGGSNILATIDSVPQKLNSVTQEIPLGGGLTSIKTVDAILDNNTLPDIGLDFDFESDSDDDSSAAEISDVTVTEPKGWEIFASAGGGSLKTKAGAGAYVDMKFSSFDVGFARTLENGGAGKLVFAPIIDYAHGNYDSYLADGTHGSGSTKYVAGGGVFRNMWDNGFYVEGSFRAGKVRNDFASNDMDKTFGQRVFYDTKATAMAGHLKLGRNLRLNRNNLLDVYATYYHAHQGGMNADLNPYGDKYRISSANSGRFKIGYRMTTRTSKISRIYTGLAYQYEHSSGITANYLAKNLSTASAGNSGSSGMLEIGWQIKPLKNNPWTVDINATGWVGHQRGVTAMAKVQKTF